MDAPQKRTPTVWQRLASKVTAVLDAQAIPAAAWTDNRLSAEGYTIMCGGSVEIGYVHPGRDAQYCRAQLTRVLSILREHFDGQDVELDESIFHVWVDPRRLESEFVEINVRTNWKQFVSEGSSS